MDCLWLPYWEEKKTVIFTFKPPEILLSFTALAPVLTVTLILQSYIFAYNFIHR